MSEVESGNDSDASIVSGTEGSDTGAGGNKKTEKKSSSTTSGKGIPLSLSHRKPPAE